jgi:Zn-dependent peptidase ImmA (M78 family)
LWDEIDFDDVQSWKAVIEEFIPEREYGFIEFHANFFAGLVLVPPPELREWFSRCIELTRQHGLDIADEASGAKEIIESHIARHFEVSRDVIHRRIETDNLWIDV